MRLKLSIFLLFIALSHTAAFGQVPESLELKSSAEFKYLGFISVYNAELYAPPQSAAEEILDDRNSKCLKLEYLVKIKSGDFVKSAEEVLSQQQTQEQLSSVRKEIDTLHNGYQDISPGDSYTLCYDAQTQVTNLFLNDKLLTAISSEEFAQVYFSIWLGEQNPLSSGLRKNLLSGPAWGNQNG